MVRALRSATTGLRGFLALRSATGKAKGVSRSAERDGGSAPSTPPPFVKAEKHTYARTVRARALRRESVSLRSTDSGQSVCAPLQVSLSGAYTPRPANLSVCLTAQSLNLL